MGSKVVARRAGASHTGKRKISKLADLEIRK